jgi:hypothetical protein
MSTEFAAAYGQLDYYTEREDGTTIGIGGMTNVSRVGSCWWRVDNLVITAAVGVADADILLRSPPP